jgi:hypothetical protein
MRGIGGGAGRVAIAAWADLILRRARDANS